MFRLLQSYAVVGRQNVRQSNLWGKWINESDGTVSSHVVSSEPRRDLIVYFHIHIRKLLRQWQDRLAPVSGRSKPFTMQLYMRTKLKLCIVQACVKNSLFPTSYLTRKLKAEWHWHESCSPSNSVSVSFPLHSVICNTAHDETWEEALYIW